METRTCYDYKGKMHTFKTDGEYFKPYCDANPIFGDNRTYAAAVLYTKVVNDKGWKIETRFGTDQIVNYDNGLVGYQCINYYHSLEEAKKHFEGYSQLSPKVGVVAYVDAWLAENPKKC